MVPEIVPSRFRDLIGTFDGVDVNFVQDRGFLCCEIRKKGTSKWLPIGMLWRFMTKTKEEPGPDAIFDALTHKHKELIQALELLNGEVLQRVEAEELLLAREELVKMGAIDRNHPLYKEALAEVAKVSLPNQLES